MEPDLWEIKRWWEKVDFYNMDDNNLAFKAMQDVPVLLSALEEALNKNKGLREALESYAECSDGCTCGDGWGHKIAIRALEDNPP